MDSTTRAIADFVTSLHYGNFAQSTVHETKRHILDSLGCAIGGNSTESAAVARALAATSHGSPPARLIGNGGLTTMEMAAFANGVSIRSLDANDSYMSVGSGHPSDLFSAVLAAADATGASGKDLILATAAGYEIFGRLADQVPLHERGWDQGLFVAPAAAAGVGLLLQLSVETMANALAIAITANVPTRQTRAGELSMWKGAATAAAAKAGVFAAQLAKAGMTGPTAAFEGRHGLWEQVTGPFKAGAFARSDSRYVIERSNLKFFPTEYHSQAPLWAILALAKDVKTEDIDTVDVQTYKFAYSEIGSEPAKWDPRTRETADHSLPYLLAVALRDRQITPAIFERDRFLDPLLRPLMAKIRITENESFTRQFPGALISEIEITTCSGRRFVARTDYPKGHARNPMSDEELVLKFRSLCADAFTEARLNLVLSALWRLEESMDVRTLLDLLIVNRADT